MEVPVYAKAVDMPEQLAGLAVKATPDISMLGYQAEALNEQERAAVIWKDLVFMAEYSNVPKV